MKLRNILISAAALSALAGAAGAQTSAVGSAQTDARIIQPISIASTSGMNFGTITRPTTATASVVTVTSGGVRSVAGGDGALAGGTVSAAAFTVNGEGALTYSLTAPGFNLTRAGGTETLAVTPALSKATGTLSGTEFTTGTDTFTVGGAMSLTNTTVTGAYTGTLQVTVAYN